MQPLKWNLRYDSRPGANDRAYVATDPANGDKYRVAYVKQTDRWWCYRNGKRAAVPPLKTSNEGRNFCDALRLAVAMVKGELTNVE